MPKVSKLTKTSPATLPGRKGLSHRAASDIDLTGGASPDGDYGYDDQFKDAEDVPFPAPAPAVPAIPPLKSLGSGERKTAPAPITGGSSLAGMGGGGFSLAGLGGAAKKIGLVRRNTSSGSMAKAKPPAPPGGGLLIANPSSLANDFRGGQESWNAMLYQLLLYKAHRGDLNIPHNDTSYRLLYNWVQTQRKHYKLYQENKTSSTFLNADRIAVLDAIDFQWNVRGDTFWQKNYEALRLYKNEHGDVRVPRLYTKNPKLGEWVTDQRRQWKAKMEGKPNMMTEERKSKLDDMGFVWKVRDRADWNDRYEQLLEFKKENGHCIVPQHYTRNRALGKWVAKQREQYRFYREGKHSFLTEERIDLLKSVGFVWQIKGRGANKKRAAAAAAAASMNASMDLNVDVKEKSLAKMELEEEENKHDGKGTGMAMAGVATVLNDATKLKLPPLDYGAAAAGMGMDTSMLGSSLTHSTLGGSSLAGSALGGSSLAGSALGGPSLADSMLGMSKSDADKLSSLPPISQQQLLQANMAAIAAHASSNQNMVADLAAALRLGGGGASNNPTSLGPSASSLGSGMTDPRMAALRAQMGNDPKGFSTML